MRHYYADFAHFQSSKSAHHQSRLMLKVQVEADAIRCERLERLAALEPEARSRKISISLEDRAGVEEFLGDRQSLRRALTNGLSNALAYAPEGSTVRLELVREKGNLAFRISDEGPGVPPEMLEKIFQPFFRADSARSRTTGGVGLGLAIARRSMEAHGGGAQAEAGARGRGLVLTLWLPWRAPEGEEPARG